MSARSRVRLLPLFIALFAAIFWNACGPAGSGQSKGSGGGGGGGGGTGSQVLLVTTTLQGSGQVTGAVMEFPITSGTGALGTASSVSGPNPSSTIVANAAGTFLFVDDPNNLEADAFSISNSGSLTAVSGSPFATSATTTGLAIAPGGKFLYAASGVGSSVDAYTINNSNGSLTAVSGSPYAGGSGAWNAVVDPSGKYLFVSDSLNSNGGISAFTINSSTGALTAISGSPFATVNGSPTALAITPAGTFLYVSESLGGGIFGLSVGSGGALTAVQASAFDNLIRPTSLVIDPAGKFLFAANPTSSSISVFSINSTSGALTEVNGSPFSASTAPSRIAIDSTGAFLYATNPNAGTVTGFSVNSSTGALTQFSGNPYSAGIQPQNLTVVTLP